MAEINRILKIWPQKNKSADQVLVPLVEWFPGQIEIHGEATDNNGNEYTLDLTIKPKTLNRSLRSWLPSKKEVVRGIIAASIAGVVIDYCIDRFYDPSISDAVMSELRNIWIRWTSYT